MISIIHCHKNPLREKIELLFPLYQLLDGNDVKDLKKELYILCSFYKLFYAERYTLRYMGRVMHLN